MPEPKGLSRSGYWLCWAGTAIAFALLAFWPNIGLGFGNTAIALFAAAMLLVVPVLWVLRLRNAGRSTLWVLPIGVGLITLSMASCDMLAGRAGFDTGKVPDNATEQALQNAVFPELALIVGLAFLAVTLIIGMLPPKPVIITESQS
ncbi:hypothetical protein [Microvirga solisilvae]|uniref:hypothetical protein n=1 Tax=Microvirga solisilvae TaxID=2919498 RepID=UPI001FAEC7E3|nr:hypothetical protein [Microvirga solisilvae]